MKNCVIRLFKWTGNIQIINWDKIDIYKFWGGLFFTICHPIYSWKYERNCYGSFMNRCENFFKYTIWSYMPFSKACRWLTHMLVHRAYDTKYLDDFYSRKHGNYTTYYSGKAMFGHYSIEMLYYKPTKRGYTKKPVKTKIASGWVFTKRKAIKLFKQIVESNDDIYNPTGNEYPTIKNPTFMSYYVDNMLEILCFGKKEVTIEQTHLNDIYQTSKDNIEKLWAYVSNLLCCQNDFEAHRLLADICDKCDAYIYWYKMMKKEPMKDYTYKKLMKVGKKEDAEKFRNDMMKEHSKNKMVEQIKKEIRELADFYLNQPLEYFRI